MNSKLRDDWKADDDRPACGGWAPGVYYCCCIDCEMTFSGDKRAFQCADCAYGKRVEERSA